MPRRAFKRILPDHPTDCPIFKKPAEDSEEINKPPETDIYTENLPSEIWKRIINFLDAKSKRQLRRVNCRLNNLVDFNHYLLSEADVYITEKSLIVSFTKEDRTEKFNSAHNAFSQKEIKKISHALRKMIVNKVWIDLHPMRISFPKLRNLLRFMGRAFAACLTYNASITITHASTLNLPVNVYNFLWKRISKKKRRIIFPFVQHTNSYRRMINSACKYNWSYMEIRYWVWGSTFANMNWITPDFHLIGRKTGKIDHLLIIHPKRTVGRNYISNLISFIRTGGFQFGIFEFIIDISDNVIDIVQPVPKIMIAQTPAIETFERAEITRHPFNILEYDRGPVRMISPAPVIIDGPHNSIASTSSEVNNGFNLEDTRLPLHLIHNLLNPASFVALMGTSRLVNNRGVEYLINAQKKEDHSSKKENRPSRFMPRLKLCPTGKLYLTEHCSLKFPRSLVSLIDERALLNDRRLAIISFTEERMIRIEAKSYTFNDNELVELSRILFASTITDSHVSRIVCSSMADAIGKSLEVCLSEDALITITNPVEPQHYGLDPLEFIYRQFAGERRRLVVQAGWDHPETTRRMKRLCRYPWSDVTLLLDGMNGSPNVRGTWIPSIIAGMRLTGEKTLTIVRDSIMLLNELDSCVAAARESSNISKVVIKARLVEDNEGMEFVMEGSAYFSRIRHSQLIYDFVVDAIRTVRGVKLYRPATITLSVGPVVELDLPVDIIGLPINPPMIRFPYPHCRRESVLTTATLEIE